MSATTISSNSPTVNDRREIFGWSIYDWAITGFFTTVITVFLGPYLTSVAKTAADTHGLVYPLGIPVAFDSFYVYCTSLSVILQVILLPILGAIGDFANLRKGMMFLFTVIGAGATVLMFFITGDLYVLGGVLLILSNLAGGAAIVLYNAYLNDIASDDQRDQVSSRGFAMGHLGAFALLIINLATVFLLKDQGFAVRLSLASAGVWWFGFSLIAFRLLRTRPSRHQRTAGQSYFNMGLQQLGSTFREMRRYPATLRFLAIFLIYNDGVQTAITVMAVFAAQELHIDFSVLVPIIVLVQFVAFMGALLFGVLAKRLGAKRAIMISLTVWSLVVIYAWSFLQTTPQFIGMAVVAGLVLGGTNALSRSLFSRMIPKGREAEFFSFYEISERGTSWLGPLVFGLVNQIYGSLRLGILSLIFFFVVGTIGLLFVDVPRAVREANQEPEITGSEMALA